ncbi:hypothetical protein FNF29_02518 [Cafeteria roenbergensis]|uniref:Uncharacterized protein n=1 Tax=Cafeteria roenbergensis TaxID=33653 RepID=A0A5A8CNJ5_CAFRO|nr:hypothetical protein FNF29_02518 [Cafeteria roenbergensis]|eukprot:KAA0154298.1 hypothetical protein FNF29_02518 [Cafeteria roenbergensis]
MSAASMDAAFRARHSVMEQQQAVKEVLRWQQSVRTSTVPASAPPDSGTSSSTAKTGTAAAHTYDRGYAKWESFDADGAADEHVSARGGRGSEATLPEPRAPRTEVRTLQRQAVAESLADVERERGNIAYRNGEFERAEAAYSRAVAADSSLPAAWANRAMARIKTSDPAGAAADASQALQLLAWDESLGPGHASAPLAGKCLLRRGGSAMDGEFAGQIVQTLAKVVAGGDSAVLAKARRVKRGLLAAPMWSMTFDMLEEADRAALASVERALG